MDEEGFFWPDDTVVSAPLPSVRRRTEHARYEDYVDRLASDPQQYPRCAELAEKLQKCRWRFLATLTTAQRKSFFDNNPYWAAGRACNQPECLWCRRRLQNREAEKSPFYQHPLAWVWHRDERREHLDLLGRELHMGFLTINLAVMGLGSEQPIKRIKDRLIRVLRKLPLAVSQGHLEWSDPKGNREWCRDLPRLEHLGEDDLSVMLHCHLPIFSFVSLEEIREKIARAYLGVKRVQLKKLSANQSASESLRAIIGYGMKMAWGRGHQLERAEMNLQLRRNGLKGCRINVGVKSFEDQCDQEWMKIRDRIFEQIDIIGMVLPDKIGQEFRDWKRQTRLASRLETDLNINESTSSDVMREPVRTLMTH